MQSPTPALMDSLYNEGHEEADDIDTHNWDAAYAQGKGDVLLNAGLAQGKEVPKQ